MHCVQFGKLNGTPLPTALSMMLSQLLSRPSQTSAVGQASGVPHLLKVSSIAFGGDARFWKPQTTFGGVPVQVALQLLSALSQTSAGSTHSHLVCGAVASVAGFQHGNSNRSPPGLPVVMLAL